jgi:outer membrane protein OmpA-like peptidoglycan-associated protein/Tol biopolymer transport system component
MRQLEYYIWVTEMTVKHYLLIFFLACMFLSVSSFGQKKIEKQINRLETEAGQLYESRLWNEAMDLYLLLDSVSPGNPEYQFRLGVIYYHSIDKVKCLPYFLKAVENGKSDPNIDFYLARAYHFNLEFNKAIDYYEKSLRLENSDMTKDKREEINKHIEDCKLAAQYTQNPLITPIVNIGEPVNSPFPEYVPLITADKDMIIFTSRRPDTRGKRIDQNGQYMEDIYVSYRKANGEWAEPDNDLAFNTPEHDACVGLSPDGKKLILYRSENGGDLFISDFDGKNWGEPVPITGINTTHWESSACFSADGKTFYFTSDRPGGYGGSDIYRAEIDDSGRFGSVRNLGPVINTEYDEDAPQIHSDGKTLFFSSRGHRGLGGFDVYSSVYQEQQNEWEPPRNIGYPINTPDDDIYFSLLANGAEGYFASYRSDSFGEKDIYMISRPGSVPTRFLMKMNLIDPFSGEQIDARITIRNTSTGEEMVLNNEEKKQGKYVFPLDFETDYVFAINAAGYQFKEKKIKVDYRADIFEYIMNIVPNREEIINLVDSTEYVNALKQVRRDELVYDDKQFLTGMQENESPAFPEILSAIAVQQKENGSEKLAADEPAYVTENESVEFPEEEETSDPFSNAVEYMPKKMVYDKDNRSGAGFQLMDLEMKRSRSKPIYDELLKSVQLSADEQWIKQIMNNEEHVIFLTRLDTRSKVLVPVINFGFDEFLLKEDYKKYLRDMAGFFSNSESSRILIAGHTDWIGTNEYNRKLSVNRARSVRDYLMETGLPENQLAIHGFGEEFPLLSNEVAWGRQVNRRASMMFVDVKDPKYRDEMYMDLLKVFGINLETQNGYKSPLIVWEKLPFSIHFPENEAEEITPYSRGKLRDLAAYLKKTPYSLVMIGFEDGNEAGDPGEHRAWLAYKYLKSMGIEDERLVLINRKEFADFYDVSNTPEGIERRKVQFFLVRH